MDDAAAIRFGTDGWRAPLTEFTDDRVRMVGQAVAEHLDAADEAGPVGIAYDAREGSPGIADSLATVLAANGRAVRLSHRDCPTPCLAWGIVERDLAGGLMVTASHNPPTDNGVKFIPADGAPAPPAVTEDIEDRLRRPPEAAGEPASIETVDFISPHATHASELLGADLSGLTVVYDAMHGSGRGVTDALLEAAGATVSRLRCTHDPTFGGTPPEPSPDNLRSLHDRVRAENAALGIANDGDADRVAVVTPAGYLDENLLFAALYAYLLEDNTGDAVRTVSTTFLIDRIAESNGQAVHETPVGFKWVAQAMAEHDALIGGEESGGFSIRGHVREKDGVLTALLAAAAGVEVPIEDRVAALLERHGEVHQHKISVDCPDDRKAPTIAALGDALPDSVAGVPVARVNDADGFKVLLEDGSWLLVRPSGTERKLRIYAEAGTEHRVGELVEAGRNLVEPLV